MTKKLLYTMLILFYSINNIAQDKTILLIGFDNLGGDIGQNLSIVESLLKEELQIKNYRIENYSNLSWKEEVSFDDRYDIVKSRKAEYSILLEYKLNCATLYLKKWRTNTYYNSPNKVVSVRLTQFLNDDWPYGLALEWAREVEYFVRYDKVKRPEVAIEEFSLAKETDDPIKENFIDQIEEQIINEFLYSPLSSCFKLRATRGFDHCTIMYGEFKEIDRNLTISYMFEGKNLETESDEYSQPYVPTRKRDIAKFTQNFIKSIDWPDELNCK